MRKPLMLALSLLGLFDSTYLWWVYTSPSRPLVCFGGGGCDAVRASSYAHLWGRPLPVFGLAMYVVLALLMFSEPLGRPWLAPAKRYLVAILSGVGVLFSAYLSELEGWVIHAWCAWCVVSALTVTAIFVLSIYEIARPSPEPHPVEALAQARRYFAIVLAALIVGIPAFYSLSQYGELSKTVEAAPDSVIRERLIRPESHVSGDPQAPVTIVEFADFQCPACGQEQEVVREIRQKYGNQLRWVFRQFPIASLHKYAEAAAVASECAADQGKFWEAVNKFYDHQTDLSNDALRRYAAELGLDTSRFNQCLSSQATLERVRRDLDDAHALGVRGTPAFFVNQRAVSKPPTVEELAQVIDQALGSSRVATARIEDEGQTLAGKPDAAKTSVPTTSSGRSLGTPSLFPNTTGAGIFAQASSAQGCSEDELKQRQPALIHTAEAQQLFAGSPKPLFVDVRSPKEFAVRRISGAINIPVEQIEQRWNILPKDRTIILYEAGHPGASGLDVCASSRAAGRALLAHDFSMERVKVYEDGLANWEKAGLPGASSH
jgi:protein-disulfide isomerase/rhodanese-related sulfurtransferase